MEGLTSVKLNLFKPKDADIAQREGIKIDKGAILTSQYLEKIEGLLRKYISFFFFFFIIHVFHHSLFSL